MTIKNCLPLALALVSLSAFSQSERKLSLAEALRTAVERNLDIQLQKIALESSGLDLSGLRTKYEPVVTASTGYSTSEREPTSSTQGLGGQTFSTSNSFLSTKLSKQEDFGFAWSLDFQNSLGTSGSNDSLGDFYSSNLTFQFSQSLLKGFSLDPEILRNDEYVARSNVNISEYDLEERITAIIQQTENAYWDLVLANEQLRVSQQSLALAKQLYEQNRIKIDVGTLAPIELINTQANIAQRESEIIQRENAVRKAEDDLKKVLNLPVIEWRQRIMPTDSLAIEDIQFDFETDYETALQSRTEIKKNELRTRNALLNYKIARNGLLPDLSLNGSYGSQGTGTLVLATDANGQRILDENGQPIVIQLPSNSTALDKVFSNELPNWSVQLALTWRPFNKEGKIALARANVALRQTSLEDEQVRINLMEDIRSSIRDLESQLKAIKASETALEYQKENLKAEEQKFQNGLSTNYQVSEAQKSLADSESALIQARVQYLKAVVNYYVAKGILAKEKRIVID